MRYVRILTTTVVNGRRPTPEKLGQPKPTGAAGVCSINSQALSVRFSLSTALCVGERRLGFGGVASARIMIRSVGDLGRTEPTTCDAVVAKPSPT